MICQAPSTAAVWVCPTTGGGCSNQVVQVPTGATTTGCPTGQGLALTSTEFEALKAAATGGASTPLNVVVTDAFGTATPEQYQAMALVFAAALTAASIIWAAKRILYLFAHPNEA